MENALLVRNSKTWFKTKLVERSLVGQFLRKFRRFMYGTFRPKYVAKTIEETRQGECQRCGKCCELLFKCPFLYRDKEDIPHCKIYGGFRPSSCRIYPFDATDSEVDGCGFSFDLVKSTNTSKSDKPDK